MPLNMNQIPQSGSKQREPIPAGTQMARLVQVIDLGLQSQRPYQGQEKRPAYEVRLTFEFPNARVEVDGESRPMWKSKVIKMSSHEKSTCRQWYEKLDPTGKYRGDWSQLLEAPIFALIVHEMGKGENAGKMFDKIADIQPPMQGIDVPPLENPATLFNLDSPDMEVFEEFPEWLKDKIKENLEFDNSKLHRMLNGEPIQYTARAEGDIAPEVDSYDTTPEPMPDVAADVAAAVDALDGDEPW